MSFRKIKCEVSYENYEKIIDINSKWQLFKNYRDKDRFETGNEPGHLTMLERESMLDQLLDIFYSDKKFLQN